MGLFWDLLQQSQISNTRDRTGNLEMRVARLETELRRTERTLHALVVLLEKHFGQDINQNGRIGD
jgi:chaperonin cofactor prefoldin